MGSNYRSRKMPELMQDIEIGVFPTDFSVEIARAGKYTLWLHTKTVYEGKAYEQENQLPEGVTVHVYDKVNGKEIELLPVKSKRSFQGEKAVSIGDFETAKINQIIEIKASGLVDALVIGVAPNRSNESLSLLFHLLGTVCLTLLPAFVILAVLLNRRRKQLQAA